MKDYNIEKSFIHSSARLLTLDAGNVATLFTRGCIDIKSFEVFRIIEKRTTLKTIYDILAKQNQHRTFRHNKIDAE